MHRFGQPSGSAAVLYWAEAPEEVVQAALRYLRADADALGLAEKKLRWQATLSVREMRNLP
jgi:predicted kinase